MRWNPRQRLRPRSEAVRHKLHVNDREHRRTQIVRLPLRNGTLARFGQRRTRPALVGQKPQASKYKSRR